MANEAALEARSAYRVEMHTLSQAFNGRLGRLMSAAGKAGVDRKRSYFQALRELKTGLAEHRALIEAMAAVEASDDWEACRKAVDDSWTSLEALYTKAVEGIAGR